MRETKSKIFIEQLKSGNHLFIRKLNDETEESIHQYIEENYHLPLPEINDLERELRMNDHQQN